MNTYQACVRYLPARECRNQEDDGTRHGVRLSKAGVGGAMGLLPAPPTCWGRGVPRLRPPSAPPLLPLKLSSLVRTVSLHLRAPTQFSVISSPSFL